MPKRIKILLAEDDPADAELILLEMRRAGFEFDWIRVDSEREYVNRLTADLDLIISDYEMPQFNGLRALELLKASGLEIPFIVISGTIGEETAVAAMKHGAADYLLKDRLARLGSAITRAMEENRLRLEREQALRTLRKNEEKLRHVFDGIAAFVALLSVEGVILELNQSALGKTLLQREDIVGKGFAGGPWWASSKEVRDQVSAAMSGVALGKSVKEELIFQTMAGDLNVIEMAFSPLRDASGAVIQIVASGIDVTKRKEAERKSREQLGELLRWQEVMLNREDRVQSLKAEVNELLTRLHQSDRYSKSISESTATT